MQAITQLPLIMLCTYVQIKVSWFKHIIVLNGLRCGIVRLFDSFVPRRSIIYFRGWNTPMYSHRPIAVVAGVKKYRVPRLSVPAPIELCVKWYGRHQCFLSRSRFTPCLSMEGGLSVIMVMEDCQCSYTGLFDQVPGVIRDDRVIQNLSLHHIFIYRKVVYGTRMLFFFSSATRTDMKSKGSSLALVCVSIKFIDFIFWLVY